MSVAVICGLSRSLLALILSSRPAATEGVEARKLEFPRHAAVGWNVDDDGVAAGEEDHAIEGTRDAESLATDVAGRGFFWFIAHGIVCNVIVIVCDRHFAGTGHLAVEIIAHMF